MNDLLAYPQTLCEFFTAGYSSKNPSSMSLEEMIVKLLVKNYRPFGRYKVFYAASERLSFKDSQQFSQTFSP